MLITPPKPQIQQHKQNYLLTGFDPLVIGEAIKGQTVY
jgi:hypothetical protein